MEGSGRFCLSNGAVSPSCSFHIGVLETVAGQPLFHTEFEP